MSLTQIENRLSNLRDQHTIIWDMLLVLLEGVRVQPPSQQEASGPTEAGNRLTDAADYIDGIADLGEYNIALIRVFADALGIDVDVKEPPEAHPPLGVGVQRASLGMVERGDVPVPKDKNPVF